MSADEYGFWYSQRALRLQKQRLDLTAATDALWLTGKASENAAYGDLLKSETPIEQFSLEQTLGAGRYQYAYVTTMIEYCGQLGHDVRRNWIERLDDLNRQVAKAGIEIDRLLEDTRAYDGLGAAIQDIRTELSRLRRLYSRYQNLQSVDQKPAPQAAAPQDNLAWFLTTEPEAEIDCPVCGKRIQARFLSVHRSIVHGS
jgi:hypothetical protein